VFQTKNILIESLNSTTLGQTLSFNLQVFLSWKIIISSWIMLIKRKRKRI